MALAASTTSTFTASVNPEGTIWSVPFWKGAGERALWTWAQTFLGAFFAVEGADISLDVQTWYAAAIAATAAAFLSVVKSAAQPEFTAGKYQVVEQTIIRPKEAVVAPTNSTGNVVDEQTFP